MSSKQKVFVYGDFNILHPGHLRFLKFAKESGNYLIVGVLSNKLSSKIALIDENIRLESINATSYVDESFILDESPVEYIKREKPHIVVKGKEHKNKENPEMAILKEYGGKLLFSSGEIGFSSLDLLQKDFTEISFSTISHAGDFIKRHNLKKNNLKDIVEKFKNLNILVIGDTIIDEYITCDPIGMSQEDPTIVVTPISSKKFIGGAAIVASHAKSLGANVNYISVIGNDDSFDFTKVYLENLKITSFLQKDTTRPTTLKQRFRASNKTLLRVNHLKQHAIDLEYEENIIKFIKKQKDLNLIIFSDFSYGVLTEKVIKSIEKFALKNSIPMVADSQSSSQIGDISKFNNAHVVTPTEREIRLALNDFESGLVVLSEKLKEKSNPKYIFTTLGSEGIMIFNPNDDGLLTDNIPALNSNAKDVSGAGDSLLTCSSMALAVGANIWESAYLGSIAASIQVSRVGNIPIKKEEVLRELEF